MVELIEDHELVSRPEPVISIKHLNVSYSMGENRMMPACRDVQFDIGPEENVGLLGESGAGKSTVAYAIMGLIEPPNVVTGEISCWGSDVLKMNHEQLRHFRWNEVAMVFQAAMNSLDPVITVGGNMDELILDKGVASTKADARELSLKLLRTMDLPEEVYKLHPFELSGGMKQRVVIAIALATNPKVLILDEPTTALDTITQFSVLSAIKSLREEGRIGGTILISHDISVQAFMVDRVLILLNGLVVEDAPVRVVVEGPKHPYTQVLNGFLKLDPTKRQPIRSSASSLNQCPFASACPYVMARCTESIPPLVTLEEGHKVACYLFGG